MEQQNQTKGKTRMTIGYPSILWKVPVEVDPAEALRHYDGVLAASVAAQEKVDADRLDAIAALDADLASMQENDLAIGGSVMPTDWNPGQRLRRYPDPDDLPESRRPRPSAIDELERMDHNLEDLMTDEDDRQLGG